MITSVLDLPQITLIALTGKDFEGHKKAIDESCKDINFGGVKLIYDYKLTSIDLWNKAIIYELHNYVDTDFALLIHADGYVRDASEWRSRFLEYDYIGAPWPLPIDNFSYRDELGEIVRVGNSVSLRSKRIMELPTKLELEWRPFFGNTNEDGFLCCHHRQILMQYGIKFAPLEIAAHFSKEHEIPENKDLSTFAFHSL